MEETDMNTAHLLRNSRGRLEELLAEGCPECGQTRAFEITSLELVRRSGHINWDKELDCGRICYMEPLVDLSIVCPICRHGEDLPTGKDAFGTMSQRTFKLD